MALPSENRLKSESLISLVMRKGASWKTPFFRAVFLPSPRKQFQSVVVVSKKYDKRAVYRNQIRRRINGILQQKFSQYTKIPKIFPKNMYVIFPYDSAKTASAEDLKKVIDKMITATENWDFSRKFVKGKKNRKK